MKCYILTAIALYTLTNVTVMAESLKVSFIAPMTGPQAVFSAAARNGIEMALDELRTPGAAAIEVNYQDSALPGFNLDGFFKGLSGSSRPDLLLLVSRELAEHAAKLSEAARIPLIAWSDDSHITDKRPHVLRSWLAAGSESQALVQEAAKRRYRNIFILSSDTPGMLEVAINLSRKLPDGSVLARRQTSALRNDFREIIQEAQSLNASAFALFLEPGQYAAFATQLKEARTTASIFGSILLYNREEVRQAGFSLSGAWFSFLPVSEQFEQAYVRRFVGESAISLGGFHHDLMKHLARIPPAQRSTDALLSVLLSPLEQSGVIGNYRFSEENGDRCLRARTGIKQITDEGFENL